MSKRYERAKQLTEKYKGKLKPCKYCGNTEISIMIDRESNGYAYSVNCTTPSCDFSIDKSLLKAIEKWNNKN